MCAHRYTRLHAHGYIEVYIRCIYACIYKNLHIYMHRHRHTFNVVFLLKFFNVSPPHLLQENIQVPQHKSALLPWCFFLPFHAVSFIEPHASALVHRLKWRHHTLATHLTASIHRPKSRTGTKWHRDSCLAFFLFPKARTEGKEKGVLWVVMPESFSAPFSLPHTCPVYKSHVIACLVCALHGRGSKVNSFSWFILLTHTLACSP